MSHFASSPTGAAGPPLRRVPTYRTSESGWTELAIQDLLDFENIIVDGIFVDAHTMHPRRPVWAQLRRVLKEHGIRVPKEPPDDGWRRGRVE